MTAHLRPEALARIELPVKQRINDPWPNLFVKLDHVTDTFEVLDTVLNAPDRERQYGVLVWGDSGVGKSETLKAYVRHRNGEIKRRDGELMPSRHARMPTFRVIVPVEESEFYVRILNELGRRDRTTRGASALGKLAQDLMSDCGVQLPIFDELHNALPDDRSERLRFAMVLKDVSTVLMRPIVFGGTRRARDFLRNEPELEGRYFEHEIKRFYKADEAFEEFLYNFEALIPLEHASLLYEPTLRNHLFKLSNGNLALLCEILRQAAMSAIATGTNKITKTLIDATPIAKSAKRKAKI